MPKCLGMSIELLNFPVSILIVKKVLYFHSDILADKSRFCFKPLIIKYFKKVRPSKTINQQHPLLKLDNKDSSENQRNQ